MGKSQTINYMLNRKSQASVVYAVKTTDVFQQSEEKRLRSLVPVTKAPMLRVL